MRPMIDTWNALIIWAYEKCYHKNSPYAVLMDAKNDDGQ